MFLQSCGIQRAECFDQITRKIVETAQNGKYYRNLVGSQNGLGETATHQILRGGPEAYARFKAYAELPCVFAQEFFTLTTRNESCLLFSSRFKVREYVNACNKLLTTCEPETKLLMLEISRIKAQGESEEERETVKKLLDIKKADNEA